jgi:signal transduction histidine kinase
VVGSSVGGMSRLRSALPHLADVALAAVVVVVGQLEVWAPAVMHPGNLAGPRWIVAVGYFAVGALVAVRRIWPFGAIVAAFCITTVHVLLAGASEGLGGFVPVVILTYSVAAYAERRRAIAGLVLVLAGLVLHEAFDPLNRSMLNLAGALPFDLAAVAAWLGGAYMRTRRLYVAELRDRAERAEREREEQVRAATAQERTRIARELHDAVAHAMSVIVVQAEAAEEVLGTNPERARVPLQRIQRLGRDGLTEMRRLLGVLRQDAQPLLGPQPGMAAVDTLLEEVRAAGLPVSLTVEGQPRPLPTGVDISAFRIVQEALTNALRHAHASNAAVVVRYGESLELEICDDGVGASAEGGAGHGLVGMRERVSLYGGGLDLDSGEGHGFRVHATLPVGHDS